ncbi:MAG: anhydro-N-acetylmuramic acid kinase [Planctomycetaceae bacterium]|nr:anhydro-N-acetylmuramic acid kinase [Planctomycetaceae bacterium]
MDRIIGVNSGSSFDGIDVILGETEVAPDGFPKPLKFLKGGSYQWPKKVQELILPAFENKVDMIGLNRLTYIAGAAIAEAIRTFMRENSLDNKDIFCVGLDGQTIYQEQAKYDIINSMTEADKDDWVGRWLNGPYPAGYQIGDTSVIAGLIDITTVTNFRQADHAQGGAAAPLMQYFDYTLFRNAGEPILSLNIGGIANVHLTEKDRNKMFAFDTGPGNLVSDSMAKRLLNQPCDYDGKVALQGKVHDPLLQEFMNHDFFKRPVPRSGWKLDFDANYCNKIMDKYSDVSKEDLLATACRFTGEAIVRSLNDYIPSEVLRTVKVMYASGGGVRNKAIMKYIQEKLPSNIRLALSDEIGIPPEYKEACKFATLAYSTLNFIADNIPAADHASRYTLLGKIAYAPWKAKCAE